MPLQTPPPSSPPKLNDESPAEKAIQLLRDLRKIEAPRQSKSYIIDNVCATEYALFKKLLRREHYGRLRFDYCSVQERLVFHMVGAIHEDSVTGFVELFWTKLQLIQHGPPSNCILDFAQLIDLQSRRSAPVALDLGKPVASRYEPDDQFIRRSGRGNAFPSLVLEVAKTEGIARLREKLQEYIVGSEGRVQFAIGLNLQQGSQRVDVIAYAPDVVLTESESETSSSEEGESDIDSDDEVEHRPVLMINEKVVDARGNVQEGHIDIPLDAIFYPGGIPDAIDPAHTYISFTFEELAQMAARARTRDTAGAGKKKRKRSGSGSKRVWKIPRVDA